MKLGLVEVHDVCPHYYDEVVYAIELLERLRIEKYSLLVVPNFWDVFPLYKRDSFAELLRSLKKEIILHGYNHKGRKSLSSILWTYGEGEFEKASLLETYKKVEKSLEVMHSLNTEVKFFVPPAWLGNRFLEDILYSFGFVGIAYRNYFKNLLTDEVIPSHSLTFSNRRIFSLMSLFFVTLYSRLLEKRQLVRFALHTRDFKDPRKVKLWRLILTKAKKQRRLISYEEVFSESGFAPSFQSFQPAGWVV
ncbi:MAG: DUF2334 domain-containing protein [Aquificaceae bacterium]